MRLSIDDGAWIDIYNLHTDAGTETADLAARNSNLRQVASYIDTWSVGNAVLVFGDTNSRYTRTSDQISIFSTQNGMADPWVQLVRGGVTPTQETICENPSTTDYCETVDKVFYRGSPIVTLSATSFNYDSTKFLQADGNILSDHNPIHVEFNWSLSNRFRQSNYWGGPHGNWFTDLPTLSSKSGSIKTSVITFRGASRLDSVGLTLTDGTKFVHGGTGGSETSLKLGQNEYWTSAVLCQGQKDGRTRNFYIQATTSAGNKVSAGSLTSDCNTFQAPAGWQIVGYMGQDGDEIDQLAFIYAPQ